MRVMVMLTRGELCVCDLMRVLHAPQSTVSRHMARLKVSGLVEDQRRGKWVYYRLAEASTVVHSALFETIRSLAGEKPYAEDLARLSDHRHSPHCEL